MRMDAADSFVKQPFGTPSSGPMRVVWSLLTKATWPGSALTSAAEVQCDSQEHLHRRPGMRDIIKPGQRITHATSPTSSVWRSSPVTSTTAVYPVWDSSLRSRPQSRRGVVMKPVYSSTLPMTNGIAVAGPIAPPPRKKTILTKLICRRQSITKPTRNPVFQNNQARRQVNNQPRKIHEEG